MAIVGWVLISWATWPLPTWRYSVVVLATAGLMWLAVNGERRASQRDGG